MILTVEPITSLKPRLRCSLFKVTAGCLNGWQPPSPSLLSRGIYYFFFFLLLRHIFYFPKSTLHGDYFSLRPSPGLTIFFVCLFLLSPHHFFISNNTLLKVLIREWGIRQKPLLSKKVQVRILINQRQRLERTF